MASEGLTTSLGSLELRSPLIAASGTVGSVWEWIEVADPTPYGAAVAKSVAPEPWVGRPPPRLAPTMNGMLNGIGIQNPGIDAWIEETSHRLARLGVPVWGSAVAHEAAGFASVTRALTTAGVSAIELNLSCPNLEDGQMFSFDPDQSARVVEASAAATTVSLGAKLSPNTPDIVEVAAACRDAGADFVVLSNTAFGFGIAIDSRRPLLSGGVGGYSGPGLKPVAMRCVYEVSQALPDLPIVGCGGVSTGTDVIEYLLAGASAVAAGTVHLAEPRAGKRIVSEMVTWLESQGVTSVRELIGKVRSW